MATVVVDDKLPAHPGIALLVRRLRWKPATAIGTVVLLWQQTRAAGLAEGTTEDILPHLPCDPPHRRGLFDALVAAGFIRNHNGPFFVIEGNAAHLALIERRRAAGRKGRAATHLVARQRCTNRAAAAPARKPAKAQKSNPVAAVTRKPAKAKAPAPGNATAWEAYREAFCATWGVEPTRNARVNSCISQFVQRVGAADAPEVLRFYLRHTDAIYLRSQHPMTLAVRDAEGLHAQWRRGVPVTSRDIRQMERGVVVRSQLQRIEAGEL